MKKEFIIPFIMKYIEEKNPDTNIFLTTNDMENSFDICLTKYDKQVKRDFSFDFLFSLKNPVNYIFQILDEMYEELLKEKENG